MVVLRRSREAENYWATTADLDHSQGSVVRFVFFFFFYLIFYFNTNITGYKQNKIIHDVTTGRHFIWYFWQMLHENRFLQIISSCGVVGHLPEMNSNITSIVCQSVCQSRACRLIQVSFIHKHLLSVYDALCHKFTNLFFMSMMLM